MPALLAEAHLVIFPWLVGFPQILWILEFSSVVLNLGYVGKQPEQILSAAH